MEEWTPWGPKKRERDCSERGKVWVRSSKNPDRYCKVENTLHCPEPKET